MKPCRNEYKAENVNNRISLTDTIKAEGQFF